MRYGLRAMQRSIQAILYSFLAVLRSSTSYVAQLSGLRFAVFKLYDLVFKLCWAPPYVNRLASQGY